MAYAGAQQVCKVKGVVTDVTGETIPYATAGASQGDKVVRRVAANADGAFTIELDRGKKYILTVTSIGYTPLNREITVPAAATCDLGVLTLTADTELEEVVVEAQKPIIKSDAEKITYDVSADPEADNKMLIDMMRKVPMVTVDAEDNVQLNGSTNFKVLVNGKESVMMKNNLKEVMKSMPANSVKDIQVITNPSTRYDAEGVGGIINIVTTREKLEGLTGSVTGYGDIMGSFGGNLYLATQYKRFTASLNYSGGRFVSKQFLNAESYNYNNPDMYLTKMYTGDDLNIDGQYHFLSFESSFELDSLNLFTLGVTGNIGNFGANGNLMNDSYASDGRVVSRYIDRLYQGSMFGGVAANLDYQHTFGKPGHTLVASYRYEYNPNGGAYSDSIILDDDSFNAPYEGQRNENHSYAQEHTVQIDYVNPINEKHSIEGGVKYIGRLNYSNDDYMMLNGGMWHSMDQQQRLNYTQQILAIYTGYAFNAGNWGARAGGRYEETWTDAMLEKAGTRVDFGKPYGNFVPYVSLNYNLDPMQSLRLSYTQRINRPGISYLSPYERWVGTMQVEYGNPDLRPEVSHSISAAYSLFKGVFNLNMEWNSRITNNSIEAYDFVEASTGTIHSTYDNIGRTQSHGMSLYVSGQLSPKFSYYSNMGARYVIYKAPSLQLENDGWQAHANLGIQWTAWKSGTISVNGGVGTPWVGLQNRGTLPWYYYGLGITQRFFDDKLKITLSGNNLFNRYNRFNNITYGDGFKTISEGGNVARNVQLSITYTFGKLDAQVKKTNRSIVNNDVMEGGSQGGLTGGSPQGGMTGGR